MTNKRFTLNLSGPVARYAAGVMKAMITVAS
jgi:hypothetical protein